MSDLASLPGMVTSAGHGLRGHLVYSCTVIAHMHTRTHIVLLCRMYWLSCIGEIYGKELKCSVLVLCNCATP